ncbi:MAG: hypothetical protein NT142_06360 [Planctomycetota bacterium]|nr:hypothetical protein [Planctomycetota bacterium]
MLLGLFRLSLDHNLGNCLRFPLHFPRGLGGLDRSNASDGSLKLFSDSGIEAFSGNACRQIDLAMKLRRNARHELTGERLVRLTHRINLLEILGDSYRFHSSLRKKKDGAIKDND